MDTRHILRREGRRITGRKRGLVSPSYDWRMRKKRAVCKALMAANTRDWLENASGRVKNRGRDRPVLPAE